MPTGAGRPDAESAVTILARLPSTMRTAARRCDVYRTLIEATSRHANDVIADADTGRPPHPFQRAEQARGAVDAVVPDLLARRDIEPPPNRLAPATLAAIFHSRGQVVAGRIAALAARHQGARAGSCAQVTCQLIAGGIQDAAQAAAAISLRAIPSRNTTSAASSRTGRYSPKPSCAMRPKNCCHEPPTRLARNQDMREAG